VRGRLHRLPGPLGEAWGDWLPAHVAWLPITAAPGSSQAAGDEGAPIGGLLLARDTAWTEQDLLLLAEWVDTWGALWRARQPQQGWHWRLVAGVRSGFSRSGGRWQIPAARWGLAVALVLCLPVRLTVLAPASWCRPGRR
jgi:hypothetical protein